MKLLYVLALMMGFAGVAQAQTSGEQAPIEAAQAVKEEGLWIDVRTAQEFAQGHLQDALNIPVEQIADAIAEVSPDKDAPIHLYCRSGRRAEAALQTLVQLGYTNVTNHGGYEDLVAKGYQ